jgi:hypothetical protein
MNEGRQITKEQAEACMRADADFVTAGWLLLYRVSDGQIITNDKTNDFNGDRWIEASSWNHERAYIIHADPNNTFERLFGTGELTFETSDEAAIWLIQNKGQQVIAEGSGVIYHVTWDGCMFTFLLGTKKVYFGFAPDYKYTIYKEPEPTTEPLTLEALEARVKALEERS